MIQYVVPQHTKSQSQTTYYLVNMGDYINKKFETLGHKHFKRMLQ